MCICDIETALDPERFERNNKLVIETLYKIVKHHNELNDKKISYEELVWEIFETEPHEPDEEKDQFIKMFFEMLPKKEVLHSLVGKCGEHQKFYLDRLPYF